MRASPKTTYDILIVTDGFATRAGLLRKLFREVDTASDAQNLLSVDMHYRTISDSAILVLHFDMRCVTGPLLAKLDRACQRYTCKMVRVSELQSNTRDNLERHLENFDIGCLGLTTCASAERVVSQKIGIEPPANENASSPTMTVRYKRGDRWHRGRICRATASGIYIATAFLPRIGETVLVELTSKTEKFQVHANIVQTTNGKAAELAGASGFGARYLLSQSAFQDICRFMRSENWQGDTFHEPPPRQENRYLLRWPVRVTAGGNTFRAIAENLSRNGLFIAGNRDLESGTEITVSMESDDGSGRITLDAKVVRRSTHRAGQTKELGYGVVLTSTCEIELEKFREFVSRVSNRASHYVLVGGTNSRVDEIVSNLTSLGYLAVGRNSPRALYELAISNIRPDAILIDGSLGQRSPKGCRVLKNRLGRKVSLVESSGTAKEAREILDATLEPILLSFA